MKSAKQLFEINPEHKDAISFSSLIDGYVEKEQIEEAVNVFKGLRQCGIKPNEFTFSSLIKACAGQAALEQGTQLHALLIKNNLVEDPFVSSVLVDMYGKCGLLSASIQAFHEIESPTDVAWNCMIGVFTQHGRGEDAMRILNQMVDRGFMPNNMTFVNLLTACSRSGLVEEGLKYFNSMQNAYGMEPQEEHYSCVIDLLGRAGRIKEAEDFITTMPFEPNAFGWCALLGACRIHGDKKRGVAAAEKLMNAEVENSGGGVHILLSDIYAMAGQWEDVKSVRKLLRDSKVRKLPGYSWVHVNNKTHVFGSEDWSHPQKREIHDKLDELHFKIRQAGYVPDTSVVTNNIEKSLKKRILSFHSERIAVAYALISIPATKPIIVKKNLRICADCHSAIKLMSKVVGRKIILRDGTRFHHFADGLCSCRDYW